MFELPNGLEGIFPIQLLHRAAADGVIQSEKYKIPKTSFQPASLDLRLGEKAYRLRCSFLPDNQTVKKKLNDLSMGEIDLRDGAILERNRPYLIPLMEELDLPKNIRAKANPRSSTGRLDIFTRVITDYSYQFDEIRPGYKGKLYLEVVSRSFTIRVQTGISLNQIRLIAGHSQCDDSAMLAVQQDNPILFVDGQPVAPESLASGIFLGVALEGGQAAGFRAKKNSKLLDLSLLNSHEEEDFWEPISAEYGGRLILEPEEFYLLLSAEGVRIAPDFAAEMAAYEPTSGELRTHYAGFFDPGFGYGPQGCRDSTRAVLEVRAHDVPFMIEDQQKVCRLRFEKLCETPEVLYGSDMGSSYQHQGLTLSKHFRRRVDNLVETEKKTALKNQLDLFGKR